MRMRRAPGLTLALLLLALVAAGCTSDDDAEAATPEPFVPVSRAVETKAGVLLGEWDSHVGGRRGATRADSQTLEDLPGLAPILSATMDPAGTRIAAMGPTASGSPSALTNILVYDLDTWELAWQVSGVPRGTLQWGATGLYLWGDACTSPLGEGRCGERWTRGIWRLTEGGAEELARFDFAPTPRTLAISSDGSTAYTIGLDTDVCCGIDVEGGPFVAVVDLRSGRTRARIPLPDVLVGQPGHWLGRTDLLFGGSYWPAARLSPDEQLLYVVHAETDEVTTVDLENGRVARTDPFGAPESAIGRLGDWLLERFARTAEAKLSAEYIRNVQVTPDGRYLLIAGSEPLKGPEAVGPDEDIAQGAAGFEVIDLATMRTVHRDEQAWAFSLAPDGYSVVTWAYPSMVTEPVGLKVLDLRTMEARSHFTEDRVTGVLTAPSGEVAYAEIVESGPDDRMLVAFDLADGTVLAERELSEYVWLIEIGFSH